MDLAERVFSDVRIPADSEEAQAAIKQLTDVSPAPANNNNNPRCRAWREGCQRATAGHGT